MPPLLLYILMALWGVSATSGAPTTAPPTTPTKLRAAKSLYSVQPPQIDAAAATYYDYLAQYFNSGGAGDNDGFHLIETSNILEDGGESVDVNDDDVDEMGRADVLRVGRPRPPTASSSSAHFNSPIYYIRLPPQPYMFVPGLGYISSSTASSQSTRGGSGSGTNPFHAPHSHHHPFLNVPISFVANGKPSTVYQWAPYAPPPPPPPKESNLHRLHGPFAFNGKPEDIFLLRDSYNSLYGDVLQNFYP